MTIPARFVATALMLGAVGCVNGIQGGDGSDDSTDLTDSDDSTDDGDEAARAAFDEGVYPILAAKCIDCHGTTGAQSTPFVAPTLADAYAYVVGSNAVGNFTTAGAPLYYKIVPGPHQGQTYTAPEQAAIQAWFDAELAAGGGGGGGGGPTPAEVTAQLISEWSGCLTLADMQAVSFASAWGNKSADGGACSGCHASGAFGFLASTDELAMYETITTDKYYMGSYFAVDIADLANAKMVPNFEKFDRVGTGEVPYEDHTGFSTDPGDGAYVALQALYDLAMQRRAAGTCGAPRIPE
jgi:hypothetical protein